MHFKSDARNNVMLVNMVLVGNQLRLFFAVKKRIRHKMPVQLLSPTAIVICVSVVQDRKTWKYNEEQPSHQFGDGEMGQTRSQDDRET